MQKISARKLLAGLKELPEEQDVQITTVVTDSRRILPQCVFVCFVGNRVDGHNFAKEAVERDAAFVVAERPVEGVPQEKLVLVSSSLQAMVTMAANYRRCFSPVVVGVTGSVGKTTTKEFCYAVFSAFGETLKTEGNQNNEIGMPNTIFRLSDNTAYAVVEMGMSNLGEISRLSKAAKPSVGIITCIGVSHLESLGSRENILKAKLELCDGLEQGAPLVLNGDDEYLWNAELPSHVRPVWVSIDNPQATIRAENIRVKHGKTIFTIVDKNHGMVETAIPTIGNHNVYNALLAYGAAVSLGLSPARAAAALERYQTTGMRQRLVEHQGVTVIEDCYNASPDSMKAAFAAMQQLPANRRCALVGDMLELGSVSQQAHKETAELAKQAGVEMLLCYGPQSQETATHAKELGIPQVVWSQDKKEMANILIDQMKKGDLLLVKASRGMQLEDILKEYYEATQEKGVEID